MKQKGFTLIELLVVIAILALLSSIVLTAVGAARAKARDTKRVADLHQLVKALELYYQDHLSYPPVNISSQDPVVGDWDVSYLPGFLAELVPAYADRLPADPINKIGVNFSFFGPREGSYYYAYYNYPASRAAQFGCNFNSDFAVIAIRQLEVPAAFSAPKAQCGTPPPGGCPDGGIPGVCRDWGTEFDYAIMLVK